MLTMVEAINVRGETLPFSLEDFTNGYILENIDGLDPVKATIVSSPFAGRDGTQFQSSRRENRNLVLTIGLEPDYVTTSVESLRKRLYDFFMPKRVVNLKFYVDDIHFVNISGIVESCETPLFSKEPEVEVSIINFDPDFLAPDSVITGGYTVADTTEQEILYHGSIETGIIFRLEVDRAVSQLMIYNRPEGGDYMAMEFSESLISGDVLEISTVFGSKRAILIRSGLETSILHGVSPTSHWMQFQPGSNLFRAQVDGAAIPYTIEYTPRYGGL